MENINTTPETLTQSLNSPIQQMPKENNIFKHLFTITVIILLILIILFFLILNNQNTKQSPTEQTINSISETPVQTNVINETTPTGYVYTYIDGKVIHEWGPDYTIEKTNESLLYTSVRLPQINSTTEVVKSINTKILDSYKYEIDVVKNNILERKYGNKGAFTRDIDYKYELKDNIVYILIDDLITSFRAGGSRRMENIFYDVRNDKQLTVAEMLTKLNISDDIILNKVKSTYPDFSEIEENQVRDTIKNKKEDRITIMPEISLGWYTLYLSMGPEGYEIRIHP